MRAAEQIQLASLCYLFYLVGYGRIVGYSEVTAQIQVGMVKPDTLQLRCTTATHPSGRI